jgi:hypothetical protein
MQRKALPVRPVDGGFTPSGGVFGATRIDKPRGHNGIDYAVPVGTPVRASLDGVVIRADFAEPHPGDADGRSYGWIVVLYHGQNAETGVYTYTVYAHLSPLVLKPLVGDRVKAGEEIALSGDSGNVKPHLHFETIESPKELKSDVRRFDYNAYRINPILFLSRDFYYDDSPYGFTSGSFKWTEENIRRVKEHLDFKAIRRGAKLVGYEVLLCGKMVGTLGSQPGSSLDVCLPAKEMLELLYRQPAPSRWSRVTDNEIKLQH